MTDTVWQIRLNLTGNHDLAGEMLMAASNGETISVTRDHDDQPWDMIIITHHLPDQTRLSKAIDDLKTHFAITASPPVISPVPDIDWLQKNWMDLKPLEIGRFWVYGSHVSDPVPKGKTGIHLDAGLAFGSGNHATTHGCILFLEQTLPVDQPFIVADIGAGSGILAIAAAKINPNCHIVAVDNDPVAVTVMQENCQRNEVDQAILCGLSDGYHADLVKDTGPYDLVLANILPSPLIAMAKDAAEALKPGGKVILSGLNLGHAEDVIRAHEQAGLVHVDSMPIGDWMTLLMEKPHA